MATTETVQTVKTAACKVIHTPTHVTVKSTSGQSYTITKQKLRFHSIALCHILTRHAMNKEETVTLTYPQMHAYRAIVEQVASKEEVQIVYQQQQEEKVEAIVSKAPPTNGASSKVAADTLKATEQRTENRTAGYGIDHTEQRINQLQRTIKATGEQFYMLIYDIPEVKNATCPNPSGLLWHYGFRLNKSCWVLPQSSLNASPVQELLTLWGEEGVEVHTIPYAESAMKQIRQIARDNLTKEIVRVHTSLIERIGKASDRLTEARKELERREATGEAIQATDYERAEALALSSYRNAVSTAGKGLDYAINCAKLFDETEGLEPLLAGLRAAIASERESLNVFVAQRIRA